MLVHSIKWHFYLLLLSYAVVLKSNICFSEKKRKIQDIKNNIKEAIEVSA